jgi:hypothetical protein
MKKKILSIFFILYLSIIYTGFTQNKTLKVVQDTIIPQVKEERASQMSSQLEFRRIVGANAWANLFYSYRYYDITPTFAYKINERTHIGGGATLRYISNYTYSGYSDSYYSYGGRIFVRYEILNSFFLHGEYEYMYGLPKLRVINYRNYEARDWIGAPLLGFSYRLMLFERIAALGTVLLNPTFEKETTPDALRLITRFSIEYEF